MPSTIKYPLLLLLIFTGNSYPAQNTGKQDLSLWTWFQVEKKLPHKQYVEFQYQMRFEDNFSRFDRSNLYFIYGKDLRKHLQADALYQLNMNRKSDQHTAFLGLSYKRKIAHHLSAYFRSSVQYVRNGFTGNYPMDRPYTEWRNRIRLNYSINNLFSTAISGEPYVKFTPGQSGRFSRIRYVWNFRYRFNKYQSFSLFYLLQPDLVTPVQRKTNYALGLTYHIRIPDKAKQFRKFFDPKQLRLNTDVDKDTQN